MAPISLVHLALTVITVVAERRLDPDDDYCADLWNSFYTVNKNSVNWCLSEQLLLIPKSQKRFNQYFVCEKIKTCKVFKPKSDENNLKLCKKLSKRAQSVLVVQVEEKKITCCTYFSSQYAKKVKEAYDDDAFKKCFQNNLIDVLGDGGWVNDEDIFIDKPTEGNGTIWGLGLP